MNFTPKDPAKGIWTTWLIDTDCSDDDDNAVYTVDVIVEFTPAT